MWVREGVSVTELHVYEKKKKIGISCAGQLNHTSSGTASKAKGEKL
jgi:hypothetical protein